MIDGAVTAAVLMEATSPVAAGEKTVRKYYSRISLLRTQLRTFQNFPVL